MIGACRCCGLRAVPLVARLTADPSERTCRACHEDPRIATEALCEVCNGHGTIEQCARCGARPDDCTCGGWIPTEVTCPNCNGED